MQVNVITSTVAGQETVATADVQAFMAAMENNWAQISTSR